MKNAFALFCLSICSLLPTRLEAASSVAPVADAYVAFGPSGNLAGNNYGGGGALAVSAGGLPNGEFQSVIRFDLASARNTFDTQYGQGGWLPQSVSLRLSSSPHNNAIYNEIAGGQFHVSLMQNDSWVEGTGNASSPSSTGINFNTLQSTYTSPGDEALGTFGFNGGSSGVNDYALELTPTLQAKFINGGILGLRLEAADSSISYLFTSRSGAAGSRPELVVNVIPEPGVSAIFCLGMALCLRWPFHNRTNLRS